RPTKHYTPTHHALRLCTLSQLLPLFSTYSAFFFYSYAAHRALHSFPTRRSSDLIDVRTRTRSASAMSSATVAKPKTSEAWATSGDRKSTRLNSSHVSISYAVFCLKKKKTN